MTAPLGTVLPTLTVSAALAPTLAAQNLAQNLAIQEISLSSSESSPRYVLAASMATVAFGTVLAGCRNDPAPAAIPHESALPPNQGHCAPGSRDPFCQGYKASVEEMRHHREEGHHSDQALTAILIGVAVFLVGVPSAIMIIRRGRKIRRLENELKEARPPESGDKPRKPGLLRRLFGSKDQTATTETRKSGESNPPANSLKDTGTDNTGG